MMSETNEKFIDVIIEIVADIQDEAYANYINDDKSRLLYGKLRLNLLKFVIPLNKEIETLKDDV